MVLVGDFYFLTSTIGSVLLSDLSSFEKSEWFSLISNKFEGFEIKFYLV
jgi:hypothetical protein